MVLTELLQQLDGLENRSLRGSGISRVQLMSNRIVGKKLLATDFKTVCKSRLILSKAQLIFFNGWSGNSIISKELTWKRFCMISCCTQGTAQTFRWPCEPTILSIGHFESPTEVQLNSWWKTASLFNHSLLMQANFT